MLASANSALLNFPTAGNRTITANYSGDANFNSSSANTSYNVNKAHTTLIVGTVTPTTPVFTQAVTVPFTIAVDAPGSGSPTGTVTVSDGTTSVDAQVSAGSAQILFPTTGLHNLSVTYNGDANFKDSTANASISVTTASTSTVIGALAPVSPSVFGQNVTVSFMASVLAPGSGTPSGNVSVGDGVTNTTVSAASGVATLAFPSVGSRTITVNYLGNANFTVSSANVPYTVNQAAATVTLGTLNQTFDGTPKTVSITTAPANLSVTVTYNGSAAAPSGTGSYTVVATINDANYFGTITGTLVISGGTTITTTNALANFSTSAQAVALSATVTSNAGVINEGTLKFEILDGTTVIGLASTSATVAGGAAKVSYNLPDFTLPKEYVIKVGYSGGPNFSASVDTSKKLLVSASGGGVGNPPIVKKIVFNRNPVRTNTVVSFTADAISTSSISTLTYEWKFFDSNKTQNGETLTGNPVSRSFDNQDAFTVIVVASDGVAKSANFTDITVTLDPNPGATAKNVFNDGAADTSVVNPVNSLGLNVPDSLGGVINFDALAAGAKSTRDADESYVFSTSGVQLGTNQFIAGKYTQSGIKVVELNATKNGVTRKARLMIPVSDPEVGTSAAINDTRSNRGTTLQMLKGKFSTTKVSQVTLTTSIEIAEGLTATQMSPVELGISNLHTILTLDAKGKILANSESAQFKKVRVKMPKLDPATHLTIKGSTMVFTLTLADANLSSAGFDTEGIVPLTALKGQAQDRSLQFAATVAGMAYQSLLKVVYMPDSEFGTIQGRK